jgi:hypothetical protein
MSRKNQIKSLRQNLLNLSAIMMVFIVVTACMCRSDRNSGQNESEEATPNQIVKTEAGNSKNIVKNNDLKNKKSDEGDFLVEHIPVQNSRYAEIDRQVKQEKLLERAADKLNRNLMLPYDIALRTKDCGEPNAYYDPQDHSVTVCYELMEHFYKLFKSTGKSDQAAYDKMFDAIRFAFLHELGHALIDAYKLPVMGNEEDAADRCSSYICLTQLGDEGVRAVLAAADAFAIEAKDSTPSNRNLADEHLLQEQRFYNTLCMIYGSDTVKYDKIVKENYLPRERAVRCPSEFERSVQSWSNVFDPWRKE